MRLPPAILLVTLLACGPAPLPTPHHTRVQGQGAPRLVVVQSVGNPLLAGVGEVLTSQLDASVWVYVDPARARTDEAIRSHDPDVIVALGSKAARFAATRFPEIPVLFTMVLNYERLGIHDRPNVMGVALESRVTQEFSQFKMVLPALRRVLAFYVAAESAGLVTRAREQLGELGIELIAEAITDVSEVEARLEARAGTFDAVWLLNDPAVMNPATFELLRASTARAGVPLLASLSDEFARRGALMSVSTDLNALGSQAAGLVRLHLEQDQTPAAIGIQPPIGTKLVVNLDVARRLGVAVPEEVLPFIDEVIEPQRTAAEGGGALTKPDESPPRP